MKTKSFTDLEQSKHLAEILPIESADMNYWCGTQIRIGGHKTMDEDLDIPCWSLAALLSVLPSGKALIHDKESRKYKLICKNMDTAYYDNPIDACIEAIENLREQMIYDFNNR